VNDPQLDTVVQAFGWSLETAADFRRLRGIAACSDVVAVLFEAGMWRLEWSEVLQLVQHAAPSALPVLCHRFSDHLDWPALADAGAFHHMPLPLISSEVRQSLGFVWAARSAAEKRSASKLTTLPAKVVA
jgi:hypothetical protein